MLIKRLISTFIAITSVAVIILIHGCDPTEEGELKKYSVTGSVFKAGTTEGIPGIQITIEPADASPTATNQDGAYILRGLVQGQTYTIKANSGQINRDYTEGEFNVVEINADQENADIILMSTRGDVVGIVTNSLNNEPLEGVRVTISPGNESRNTGTDGTYTFDDLEEREFTLQFIKSGYQSDNKVISTVAGSIQNGDISLTPIAPITVNPSQIDYGTSLSSAVITVTNETSETLNYEIQAANDWIKPERDQGIITGLSSELIQINVDRGRVNVGEHQGVVAVNVPGRGTRTVEVLMERLPATSAVLKLLSEATLNFGTTIETRTIGVKNEGSHTLNWELTVSQPWLSVTKEDGSLPPSNSESFSIIVNREGLTDGIYNGTVDFSSNGGTGSIFVIMEVQSDNSGSGDMVVTSGLRAYYTFDDGPEKDEQGNVQASVFGATTSMDTPTGSGFSMSFDGDDDYLQLSGNPIRNTNHATIHATINLWLKSSIGGALFAIPYVDNDSHNEFILGIKSNRVRHSLDNREDRPPCCSGASWGIFNTNVATLLLDEDWHMLTVVYDGATKEARLYVDGTSMNSEDYLILERVNSDFSRIGKDYYNGTADIGIADFNGMLDNIRFYSRPLVASEVKEIFDARQ